MIAAIYARKSTKQDVADQQTRRTRTAYHEAGHAVAHIVLGLWPISATIVTESDSLGHVMSPNPIFGYEGTVARDRAARARDQIVTDYAGLAAEHVFCAVPFSFEEGAKHGAWGDHRRAWELLLRHVPVRRANFVGDEAYDAALIRLQRRALKLVRAHRSAIERVTQLLLKRKTLTGEEIQATISTKEG